MQRLIPLTAFAFVVACSDPKLLPPDSAQAVLDGCNQMVQVTISSIVPPTAAALVAPDGARYQALGYLCSAARTSLTTRRPPPVLV